MTAWIAPFAPTYISDPFPNGYDPIIMDGASFADGKHRLVVHYVSDRKLYKTADFETWETVNVDWMSGVPTNSGLNTFAGHVVLGDGTFAFYQNDDSEGKTAVWTGSAADVDAGTLTRQGRVLGRTTEPTTPDGGDCGVFYEAATDLVHVFTEDPANPIGQASSSEMLHFTTPGDDLLTPTQHSNAFSTGGAWGTGDPCVVEVDGTYFMFADFTVDHPAYWTTLLASDDLYSWTILSRQFTADVGVRGGDFDILDVGDRLIAFTEYSNNITHSCGMWEFRKAGILPASTLVGSGLADVSVGGASSSMSLAV